MNTDNLKILLVDDEPGALELMEELLKDFPYVVVTGKARNRLEAIAMIREQKPNVVFQDIEMGGKNGLELVDEYRLIGYTGKIVFVTAYQQYAIDAIRKAAFDYLLKPVDIEDLENMLKRLMSLISSRITTKFENKSLKSAKLRLPTRTGFRLINFSDIIFFEAEGNYTNIHLSDGCNLMASSHLGRLEYLLDKQIFFRISRSHIINLDYLLSVHKAMHLCLMKSASFEIELPISKARMASIEAFL